MKAQFEMLSVDFIKRWVAALRVPGQRGKARGGATMNSVARFMGIPKNSLVWIAHRPDTAVISLAMQRRYSKAIAMIENGQVEFVRGKGRGKPIVAVLVDKPRPIARYAVKLGKTGPTLEAAKRPAPFAAMPTFKDLLLK